MGKNELGYRKSKKDPLYLLKRFLYIASMEIWPTALVTCQALGYKNGQKSKISHIFKFDSKYI